MGNIKRIKAKRIKSKEQVQNDKNTVEGNGIEKN